MARNIATEGIPEPGKARVSAFSPVATGENDATRSGNILAILAKSENVTDYIEPDSTVILDPPRAGCDKKLIEKLLSVCPEKIIYLSCNPATQARDTKLLLSKYQIGAIKTFNFFPHTPHIENLVILKRK
jgi:23S rRNA (uracil1939-C5)-methyltransferase